MFIAFKGLRTGFKWSSVLLLTEYVFLVFCSTVIFRPTGETRQYDFHPFWSYDRPELLVENIMNVVVLVPVGMVLGFMVHDSRSNEGSWLSVPGSWLIVTIIGCGISFSIEAL